MMIFKHHYQYFQTKLKQNVLNKTKLNATPHPSALFNQNVLALMSKIILGLFMKTACSDAILTLYQAPSCLSLFKPEMPALSRSSL